jgi:hypothetical protein
MKWIGLKNLPNSCASFESSKNFDNESGKLKIRWKSSFQSLGVNRDRRGFSVEDDFSSLVADDVVGFVVVVSEGWEDLS